MKSGAIVEMIVSVVSGRDAVRALGRIGYEVDRQKGSHLILRQRLAPYRRLTVPDHKELRAGTLRAIIRQAGLSVEESSNLP
jgi:predicted RNA binding protein YcfA (HicA-like mRNA interferase family)